MVLNVVERGHFRSIIIPEGHILLLPPRIPHSPQRFADTIGVVLERRRPESELDGLIWFNQDGGHALHEEYFHCQDLGTQLAPIMNRVMSSASIVNNTPDETPLPRPYDADTDLVVMDPIPLASLLDKTQHLPTSFVKPVEFHLKPVVHGEAVSSLTATTGGMNCGSEALFWQIRGSSVVEFGDDQQLRVSEGELLIIPAAAQSFVARGESVHAQGFFVTNCSPSLRL